MSEAVPGDRYYSDVQNLLRDAFQWPGLDGLLSELRAIDRRGAGAPGRRGDDADLVLARQAQIRAPIAMSYAPGAAEKGSATRPAFRLPLIDAVLEPAADRLEAGERRRLQMARRRRSAPKRC